MDRKKTYSGGSLFAIVSMAWIFLAPSVLASAVETVALWRFEEAVESSNGAILEDASGNGYDLTLGSGRIVDDGKFGNGLLCPPSVSDFVARREGVQMTPLSLGNWDWTIEWWQRRDAPLAKGHAEWIYLLCDNAIDPTVQDWQKGFQTEARFSGAGFWSHDGSEVQLGVVVDKFDEVCRLSLVRDVHPDLYQFDKPVYHHIAWVYNASIKRLMYFEDGEGPFYIRDGASVAPGNQTHSFYGVLADGDLDEYPDQYESYNHGGDVSLYVGGENAIGPDRDSAIGVAKIPEGYRFATRPRAEQTARSVIDEMRVSRGVRYSEPFTPPATLGGDPQSPWLEVSQRRWDPVAVHGSSRTMNNTIQLKNSGSARLQWRATTDTTWLAVAPADGTLAPAEATTLTLTIDAANLETGNHKTSIGLQSADAASPPQSIDVWLGVEDAETAVWLFDEPLDTPHRFQLEDQTIHGYDLTLGPGGTMAAGKFGRALDPRGRGRGHSAVRRYIDHTHLNLGDFDWTWECWVKLNEAAAEGDVLFLLRQNIMVESYPDLTGVGAACGLLVGPGGASLNFINERSGLTSGTLQTNADVLRGTSPGWHHLAVGYAGAMRQLTHWVNGVQMDSIALDAPLAPLLSTGENNLSVGKTIDDKHAFPGLFDEMRVSAIGRYRGDFELPASLAPQREPIAMAAGPHLFIDDYLIAESTILERVTQTPERNVPKPEGWDAYAEDIAHTSNILDRGPDASDPEWRYMKYGYRLYQKNVLGQSGIHMSYAASPEGPWTPYENNPVIPYTWVGQPGYDTTPSDIISFIRDPDTGLYLFTYKTYPMTGENPALGMYRDERWNYQNRTAAGFRRLVAIATSRDGIRWSNPQRIHVPDDDDRGETQFHVYSVFKRGEMFLAHMSSYRDDVDRSVGWTNLATSRDMYHWQRWRDPLIDYNHDPTGGEKFILPMLNQDFFIQDDWIYLAYMVGGGHKPPRSWHPAIARLPLDRFVSRETDGDGDGILLTPLMMLDEAVRQMQLNAAVDDGGEIRMQVRNEQGDVIEGFTFEDIGPIAGDAIRHPVQWKNTSNLEALAQSGRPIRLEWRLRDAALYGFYLE